VVVAFVLVVVVVVFVADIPCDASGSIKVVLLFSVLAKPEYGVKVKLPTSVVVRNNTITKLIFCIALLLLLLISVMGLSFLTITESDPQFFIIV
jgi:hypothetical protein